MRCLRNAETIFDSATHSKSSKTLLACVMKYQFQQETGTTLISHWDHTFNAQIRPLQGKKLGLWTIRQESTIQQWVTWEMLILSRAKVALKPVTSNLSTWQCVHPEGIAPKLRRLTRICRQRKEFTACTRPTRPCWIECKEQKQLQLMLLNRSIILDKRLNLNQLSPDLMKTTSFKLTLNKL